MISNALKTSPRRSSSLGVSPPHPSRSPFPIRHKITVLVMSATLLGLAGCDIEGQMGDLGRCRFVYWCTNSAQDAACKRDNPPPFPEEIAVNAPFEMTCTENKFGNESTAPKDQQYRVVPASKHFGQENGRELRILKEGPSSFLAVTSSGEVVDVIQLVGVEIDEIVLELTSSHHKDFQAVVEDTVRLEPGDEVQIRAVTSLAGAVSFDWQIEGDAIESTKGSDGSVLLSALTPGVVHLRVSFGQASRSVEIAVEGEQVEVDAEADKEAEQ